MRATGDNRSAARQTIETFWQHVAADVLDDHIHAALVRELADFNGPMGLGDVHHKFRTKVLREPPLCFRRTGADNPRPELFGNLNRRRANAARTTNGQHPVAGTNLRPIGEHVHGGAAREGERGGGGEIYPGGQAQKHPCRHHHSIGKPAVAPNPEQFAAQTEGFIAPLTEFALATEQVGLHRNGIAEFPFPHSGANGAYNPRHLTAGRPRQGNRHRQSAAFEPEIEVIQSASFDLDDYFSRSGLRLGQFAQLEFTGRAASDKLNSFHVGILRQREEG
ncbi:MAG: hypothetical protein V9H26_17570 [Verrucomicrobiota bacterium]